MNKPTNFKLGIGLPCSWPHVPFPTFLSILKMERPDFTLIPIVNGPVDELRNRIVEDALALNCSHLLMMDLDQTYPVNTIPRLLSHNLDVVGCLVHRRYPPFSPLILRGDIGNYELIEDYEDNSLLEVDATGTGCLLFNMDIFRKMSKPWFQFKTMTDGRPIGEDIGFCSDLRNAGYKIFVDTAIKCGHLSTMEITAGTYDLYRAMKKAQEKGK